MYKYLPQRTQTKSRSEITKKNKTRISYRGGGKVQASNAEEAKNISYGAYRERYDCLLQHVHVQNELFLFFSLFFCPCIFLICACKSLLNSI